MDIIYSKALLLLQVHYQQRILGILNFVISKPYPPSSIKAILFLNHWVAINIKKLMKSSLQYRNTCLLRSYCWIISVFVTIEPQCFMLPILGVIEDGVKMSK